MDTRAWIVKIRHVTKLAPGVYRSLLVAALVLLAPAARSSERIRISLEYARPVLQWSNHIADAYVIETRPNLASGDWQQRVVLTTDASTAA